jgi:hypothetical protein
MLESILQLALMIFIHQIIKDSMKLVYSNSLIWILL